VTDAEGVIAHFIASSAFTRAIAAEQGEYLNTDDRNLLEFAFARTAGNPEAVDDEVREGAVQEGEDRPALRGEVDWESVADQRLAIRVIEGRRPTPPRGASRGLQRRAEALARYVIRDAVGVVATWESQDRLPSTFTELEALGESLAEMGDPRTGAVLDRLRALSPIEADALAARWKARSGRDAEAADFYVRAFEAYRADPWPNADLLRRVMIDVGLPLAEDARLAERVYAVLAEPFSLHALEEDRLRARLRIALRHDFDRRCVEVFAAYEPWVPWDDTLRARARCYGRWRHPLLARAERDLAEITEQEGRRLSTSLLP
jgi:hypothetical protein